MIARALALVLALAAASRSPGESLAPTIPPGYLPSDASDESGLWVEMDDYERQLQRSALLVRDPQLNNYVRNTMCRVAGDYCADLRVYIIRNPDFNAAVSANGIVVVWTGLLTRVSSEDELAAVLGHELAHYTQLHSLESMRRETTAMTTGTLFDFGLLVLTGIDLPVGEMGAKVNVHSFSRANESEADLLGLRFIAEADYDPAAAVRVWEMVVAEERRAVAKRDEQGLFSRRRPSSEERIAALRQHIDEKFDSSRPSREGVTRHVAVLNRHYDLLMEDQLDTNRYGRTEDMLERHRALGVRESLVDFYYGEIYRQRGDSGDEARAINAYERAARGEQPAIEAWQQLGYLYMKRGDDAAARESFETYLALEPEADDHAMIEFYLEQL